MADFVSGTVGGVSGWWSARNAEQEREAAEAAEGAWCIWSCAAIRTINISSANP